MQGTGASMMSSPSMTAKGSSPTRSFAISTAWPSPRVSFWRTYETLIMLEMARTCSSRSVLPRSSSRLSSSYETSKWSSIAFLPRPVTMMMLVRPAATASSTTYWMIGLSTSGSISFGCALVAGRKRVPRPAAGKTALRILFIPENASTALRRAILRVLFKEYRAVLDLKRVVDEKEQVLERLRRRGPDAERSLLDADPWTLDQERRAAL